MTSTQIYFGFVLRNNRDIINTGLNLVNFVGRFYSRYKRFFVLVIFNYISYELLYNFVRNGLISKYRFVTGKLLLLFLLFDGKEETDEMG